MLLGCLNCGNKISDKADYCPKCGNKLEWIPIPKPICEECNTENEYDATVCYSCLRSLVAEKPKSKHVLTFVKKLPWKWSRWIFGIPAFLILLFVLEIWADEDFYAYTKNLSAAEMALKSGDLCTARHYFIMAAKAAEKSKDYDGLAADARDKAYDIKKRIAKQKIICP